MKENKIAFFEMPQGKSTAETIKKQIEAVFAAVAHTAPSQAEVIRSTVKEKGPFSTARKNTLAQITVKKTRSGEEDHPPSYTARRRVA